MIFDINILLSLNQSINEWNLFLKKIIDITSENGIYILGEKWIEVLVEYNSIDINKILEFNTFNTFIEFIKYLDYVEQVYTIFNKLTINLLDNSIISYTKDKLPLTEKNIFDEIIKNIHEKQEKATTNFKKVANTIENNIFKIIKDIDVNNIITEYESSIPHGKISTDIYVLLLKNNKKIALLEQYKNILLEVKKDKYINNNDVHPIQKINYLIQPFSDSSETKKGIDISISNYIVEYNILPLISIKDATKFGPLTKNNSGINKQLINRFKTIKIINNVVNTITDPNIITSKPLNIYTGANFKTIKPIQYKEGYEWLPMAGISYKTYRYNEILEKSIFNNMKLDNTIYKSFNLKNLQSVVSVDVLKNSDKSISDVCYEEMIKLLYKKSIEKKDVIGREMFLTQFFNINKIIENVKHREMDLIEIIPLSKSLAVYKLI